MIEETEKDKSIIKHLAKTITDMSKVLIDFGNSPPIIPFLKDKISENYFNSHKNNVNNEEVNVIISNARKY